MAKHPQGATKHKRKRTVKINDKWYFSETIWNYHQNQRFIRAIENTYYV